MEAEAGLQNRITGSSETMEILLPAPSPKGLFPVLHPSLVPWSTLGDLSFMRTARTSLVYSPLTFAGLWMARNTS